MFATTLVLGVSWLAASEDILRDLPFRAIGPAVMGGRIGDVAVDEARPWVFYVGSASGGVFKTTNNGTTFDAIFDDQGSSSIGDIALAPSDPETVWVGTGEANNRQSSSFGDGVYKSTDGGRTFMHVGLRETGHIGRIVIDSRNPEVVYVAAVGRLWGANPERGIYKTEDGGATWKRVLFVDPDTGATDVAIDPASPNVLYAATYQRRRAAWGFNGGGPGSGIHKSTDGGKTWRKLTQGLPSGPTGRIGLDLYRRDPRIVYATVENKDGGIFRSEDRGETWKKVSSLNPRPMYYSQIRVDPQDDKRIYVLGAAFYVSADGGKTFADPKTGQPGENESMTPAYDVGVHGDHHALWIDPQNSRHLILGGDGGLYFSWDGSISWDKVANLPLVQFYDIAVDMQKPYFIYGGAQDTHSWGGPSATRHHIGIVNGDWFQVNFGDGMYQQIDPADPETVYTSSQDGNIIRFNRKSADSRAIRPAPAPGENEYRFHWTSPILISPHDPKTVYLGGNRLFRTVNGGESWTASIDLTRNQDRRELPIMGVMADDNTLSRNDGVSDWGTITTLAESPRTPGLVYVGTDDGQVQRSSDSGASWVNLTGRFPGLPGPGTVSRVLASGAEPGRVYVTFDRHHWDDFSPYVFVSEDRGETWRSIASNLPRVGWTNAIAEHHRNPDLLFLGTETGLFVSFNRGTTWEKARGTFPTVPVDDIVVHPRDNDLVVGTHGRGIYILDDITPLERMADAQSKDAFFFPPRAATQVLIWKNESYGAQRQFIGPNPPAGALLHYFLKSPAAEVPRIAIFDSAGVLVREIVGPEGSKASGLHRVVWDLRRAAPPGVSGRGPLVLPGTYAAKLKVGTTETTVSLVVESDPLQPVSTSDLRARHDFLTAVDGLRATAQGVTRAVEEIQTQLDSLLDACKKAGDASSDLVSSGQALSEEVKQIRTALAGAPERPGIRARAQGLFTDLEGDFVRPGTLSAPTEAQERRLDATRRDLKTQVDVLNRVLNEKIPSLNQRMNDERIPRIRVSTKVPPVT